jgi:ethanolamine ammonia-lyase small subunit
VSEASERQELVPAAARLSLGSTAQAVSTREQLRFQHDHALARDAVHARMDTAMLTRALRGLGFDSVLLHSAVAAEARQDRRMYLRRPDLGRRLDAGSRAVLEAQRAEQAGDSGPDLAIVLADGLSAVAVEQHAVPLLEAALPLLESWRIGPVCIAAEARVALGDEAGEMLRASCVVVLIGERPGLSSADSLGVYITWQPRLGRTDAERNCISNVRVAGLSYAAAARRLAFYLREARRLGLTGVALKEGAAGLAADAAVAGADGPR